MTTNVHKRPIGRPRMYPATEKRPTITFRIRDHLYAQVREQAGLNDRSLSEEIERSLERYYDIRRLLDIGSTT